MKTTEHGPLLAVRDLSVDYGALRAVDEVNFELDREEIVALIGPNGAGKTTAFNAIWGLVPHKTGTVTLDGQDLGDRKPHEIARAGVARTFQRVSVFPRLSVRTNIEIGVGYARHGRLLQELPFRSKRRASLQGSEEEIQRWAEPLRITSVDVEARNLPYGTQRILAVVVALARAR